MLAKLPLSYKSPVVLLLTLLYFTPSVLLKFCFVIFALSTKMPKAAFRAVSHSLHCLLCKHFLELKNVCLSYFDITSVPHKYFRSTRFKPLSLQSLHLFLQLCLSEFHFCHVILSILFLLLLISLGTSQ